MTEPDPERVSLELRIMKLERFLQELSDVVVAQGRSIEALTREVGKLRGVGEAGEEAAGNERPPHY
jgi:uncharacterized coiled-coil protein SlyX